MTYCSQVPQETLPAIVGESSGTTVATLYELDVVLTPIEEKFARYYVLCNNATQAYIEAVDYKGASRNSARVMAWELANRPHVLKRIREYESAAAAAVVIDYAAILDHDRQIVEGHKHADEITQHIWECCRYCHGINHKFQWIDHAEYFQAVLKTAEDNEARAARKQRELPPPSDEGGFGFSKSNDPNILCPHCEGRGHAVTVIADTTKLRGPARVAIKGVEMTNAGPKVVWHDVDKAKDRLLRAGGIFQDDAASVARGAAAGAAAGATAAIAASKAMTADEAQRLYLELA